MPLSTQESGFKPGDIKPWPVTVAPAGWVKANGALVSRSAYAALFEVIGTTFGAGDGSTTFALPDFRGEFIRGLDDGRGVDLGRGIGTYQTDTFQGHAVAASRSSTVNTNVGTYMGTGGSSLYASNWVLPEQSLVSNGNGTPRTSAETRARNIALLVCIKY